MGRFRGFVQAGDPVGPPAVSWNGGLPAAAAAPATRSALRFRARFVDIQSPAVELSAVKIANGAIAFIVAAHFDKRKTAGLARVAIGHNVYTVNRAEGLKHGTDGSFGGPEAEITYKNIFHLVSFF
jgi:hypothetical protein